jgi:glycosyltransferase involved in cell wall biosynthesis
MKRIGYIIRSYPRLSQTFIMHEILALEEIGVGLSLFPITDPHEPVVQAQAATVRAPVEYLEVATRRGRAAALADHLRAALAAPIRYVKTLRYVLWNRELDEGYTTASRWECLAEALYLVRLLRRSARRGAPIDHLHAHFAHDPTLIGLLVQKLTGISFSFTAHARDLFQIPRTALAERIAAASAVITCCGANLDYLHESAPADARGKIRLIHHGVDLRGFQPTTDHRPPTTDVPQSKIQNPKSKIPLIMSVGRLVEKKGFPDLLRACALLKERGYHFRCAIYGEGPLRGELAAQIAQHGLGDMVALPGAVAQSELVPVFQRTSVFALTPFVTEDGDRDGVPNVLVEAMACGVPVVATAISGIPELVVHEQNGLLVAPHDPTAIADALAALLDDDAHRAQLGAAARSTVVEHFDLRAAARELAALFERALPQDAGRTTGRSIWQRALRRLVGIGSG